ncbi:MAG TPA: beta-lactamase family protein [Firmicutes bacterium]|nr:beta-lactamase family protein [Bacillota bacterium]
MSKHTLQQMKERLAQELGRPEHQVIRFAYVQDGEWAEQAFLPACPRLECFSVTKSFTATGIGLAEAEGLLSLDDPLPRFFAAEWPAGADPRLERVTVRHLLTHTMGLGEGILFDHQRYALEETDWLKYALSAPLPYEPGTHFTYSNSTIYLLARILRKAAGVRADEYLEEKLMRPLGMGEHAWEHDPDGETFGAAGLFLSTRDMAKLGLLYLNGGVYGGRRVLPEGWVRRASRCQTGGLGSYGYGFWIFDGLGFAATGAFGQIILVLPEQNAVLAAHAFHPQDVDYPAVMRRILAD